MAKISITRADVIAVMNTLTAVVETKQGQFSSNFKYAQVRNKKYFKDEYETLLEIAKDKFAKFVTAKKIIDEDLCTKESDGTLKREQAPAGGYPVMMIGGVLPENVYVVPVDKRTEYGTRIAEAQETLLAPASKEFEALLRNEVEVDVYKVNMSELPRELGEGDIFNLFTIIEG